ncbi:MAG: hypothetical protein U1D41_03230 [Nitrosomonas sp.]|uniref:hypothetical protein n=1 Tax=Nitrosomonas sp. TaxID=42353 RepID=UPI002732EEB9|nr:hypothetical protein [Nitrosomonas sp.]MDP3664708.1 hypothetical protein [Nitrosomonas sp.]MDZ4105169.1 hypothetical protein [Nitrosomonas sp.]
MPIKPPADRLLGVRRLFAAEVHVTIEPPPDQLRPLIVTEAQHTATAEQEQQTD